MDEVCYFKKQVLIIIVVMIFSFQFLKRDFNNIQEFAVYIFIHVGINAKMGVFSVKLFKSAKQPIPYTQYISIITIGIRQSVMVMYVMQVGCDEDQANNFINPIG